MGAGERLGVLLRGPREVPLESSHAILLDAMVNFERIDDLGADLEALHLQEVPTLLVRLVPEVLIHGAAKYGSTINRP
jgi:hypothetical protein